MALGTIFLIFSQIEKKKKPQELGFSECQHIPKLLEYKKIDSL